MNSFEIGDIIIDERTRCIFTRVEDGFIMIAASNNFESLLGQTFSLTFALQDNAIKKI